MRPIYILLLLITVFLGFNCNGEALPSKKELLFHKSHEPKKADAPFSDIVQVGDLYFLSGQVGMDHKTRKLVEGGIEAQIHQVFKNLSAVCEAAGGSLQQIAKLNIFLTDLSDGLLSPTLQTTKLPLHIGLILFRLHPVEASCRDTM